MTKFHRNFEARKERKARAGKSREACTQRLLKLEAGEGWDPSSFHILFPKGRGQHSALWLSPAR